MSAASDPAPGGRHTLGDGPRLLGQPPVGMAGSCLWFWSCPGVLVFSSLSTQDAARSRTSTKGGCCRRMQGTTHRLLCVLRGDGSNAAGTRWRFAGDACGGSPIPEKERSSDSPHTSLLTLCKRCSCPGMQCLASVGVRKGKAAVFPGSSMSMQPEKIALLATSEATREFL